jgi:hypothetical protein
VVSITPRKEPPVPTEQEAGWTPEPVCTLWELCRFLLDAGFWPTLFFGPEDDGDNFLLNVGCGLHSLIAQNSSYPLL